MQLVYAKYLVPVGHGKCFSESAEGSQVCQGPPEGIQTQLSTGEAEVTLLILT